MQGKGLKKVKIKTTSYVSKLLFQLIAMGGI